MISSNWPIRGLNCYWCDQWEAKDDTNISQCKRPGQTLLNTQLGATSIKLQTDSRPQSDHEYTRLHLPGVFGYHFYWALIIWSLIGGDSDTGLWLVETVTLVPGQGWAEIEQSAPALGQAVIRAVNQNHPDTVLENTISRVESQVSWSGLILNMITSMKTDGVMSTEQLSTSQPSLSLIITDHHLRISVTTKVPFSTHSVNGWIKVSCIKYDCYQWYYAASWIMINRVQCGMISQWWQMRVTVQILWPHL